MASNAADVKDDEGNAKCQDEFKGGRCLASGAADVKKAMTIDTR